MKSGIYKITNEVTGKFYIGSAKDIDWRWYVHKHDLRTKTHCNPKLQHSWDYHGEEKFLFTVIEEVEPEQAKLFEREQYYLDTLKPYERNVGYNIGSEASGGDNITHHPDRDAFIQKMSQISMGENNPMFGQNHSDEARKKQKEMAKGRFTLEWFVDRHGKREGKKRFIARNVALRSRKINYSYQNINKGKHLSPMSEASKQKITETKHRMKKIKPLLIGDIKSDRYTTKMLMDKYDINMNVVKHYKRKLKGQL